MKEIGRHYTNILEYRRKDLFKNYTKEERAKELNNIICPRCKYQNHKEQVAKYGKCNLCGVVLDKNYFTKTMLRRLKNEKNK